MKSLARRVVVVIAAVSIGMMGCAKSAVKVKPALPEAKSPVTTPAVQKPSAASIDEFKPVDMDEEARKALQTVYFDFDKYDLRPDAISILGVAAKFLQDHPTVRVLIQGNCDERGSEEYNMALGEKRAKAAKNYLVSYGISTDRVETTSYGKERLAKTGCTDDACHQLNRRDDWQVCWRSNTSFCPITWIPQYADASLRGWTSIAVRSVFREYFGVNPPVGPEPFLVCV